MSNASKNKNGCTHLNIEICPLFILDYEVNCIIYGIFPCGANWQEIVNKIKPILYSMSLAVVSKSVYEISCGIVHDIPICQYVKMRRNGGREDVCHHGSKSFRLFCACITFAAISKLCDR